MQESRDGNIEPEREPADSVTEKHREKGSYYYDDAHGYEEFDPNDDDADEEETPKDRN
jgi:hypothetical protein